MACAQEMPSVHWPDMHSTNVGLHTDALIWVRRIPGSHVGVLDHIYILGLEVIKTAIIYLLTLIKVKSNLTAKATEVV